MGKCQTRLPRGKPQLRAAQKSGNLVAEWVMEREEVTMAEELVTVGRLEKDKLGGTVEAREEMVAQKEVADNQV